MAKVKSRLTAPAALTADVLRKFPGVFDAIDAVIAQDRLDVLPTGVVSNVLSQRYNLAVTVANKYADCVHALYVWGRSKHIYEFDPDIANELVGSFDSAATLPIEVFSAMPFDGLYMSVNATPFSVFATKSASIGADMQPVKSIVFYFDGSRQSVSIPLIRGTVARCMTADYNATMAQFYNDEVVQCMRDAYPRMTLSEIRSHVIESYQKEYQRRKKSLEVCISLLLYLCSQNAEITNKDGEDVPKPEPEGAENAEQPQEQPQKKPKKPKKVQALRVGYRIGKAIRYHKQQEQDGAESKTIAPVVATGSHTKKAAHVRRGHYHHYWTGSKKDGTRKLILKWTAPAFINASGKDLIPTKHAVKK